MRTVQDCEAMREGVPALRKKKIAIANIDTHVGLIASTPSGTCKGHCTWWRSSPANEVHSLFTASEVPPEAAND